MTTLPLVDPDSRTATGTARIGGRPLVITTGGEVQAAAATALRTGLPLLVVVSGAGRRPGRLTELARAGQALAGLRDAGLLSIALVTGPAYGTAASIAMSCDVVVMEHGARLGFAEPHVIERTIRDQVPPDFQTADHLLAQGQVDAVGHRADLRAWLTRLLSATAPATPTALGADPIVRDTVSLGRRDPWRALSAARATTRPTALDYVTGGCADFVELHGDRVAADCPSVVAGFARLAGRPIAVVGHQKGHRTTELVHRNFGMPGPAGYRKALRVMRLAARLGMPVVTIVDTPGAHPGRDAGQAGAIAACVQGMCELPTPIVAVITGEAVGDGALALAVADRVLMFELATYATVSPETAAAALWGDVTQAPAAARTLGITAGDLLDAGVVDGALPESGDMVTTFAAAVARSLDELSDLDQADLPAGRRARNQVTTKENWK